MHQGVHSFLQKMKMAGANRNIPNISWNTAHFLAEMIQKNSYKDVLEIGSANGFSTICLAEATDQNNGTVTSIEMSRHAFEEACENFTSYEKIKSGDDADWFSPAVKGPKESSGNYQKHLGNISLYFGNALEILPHIHSGETSISCEHPISSLEYTSPRTFDLIFIDGQFVDTLKFYLLSTPLLNPGGTIVIDDAVKYAWKMEGFFEYLEKSNIAHSLEKLDEDDGVLVIVR